VYVADTYNYTIRKVTTAGVVTTLAGSAGNSGSVDGTNSTARFLQPWGLAIDSDGNLYVAEYGNHTIRKVTPAGVVTTIAGNPSTPGSADGTNTTARFNFPTAVTVDNSNNVYVADAANHTIRKVTPAGVVTTVAGSAGISGSTDGTGSSARFNNLNGVVVDGAGNLYVADNANHTIRKVTPAGVVTTLGGSPLVSGSDDGTGNTARFKNPHNLAVDSAGTLYVTDYLNSRISKGVKPPPDSWQADLLRARTDGRQHLLWRHLSAGIPDGQVSLWTLNSNALLEASTTCGPYADWSVADMVVSRPANTPHLAWTNTSGAISIWNFNSSGAYSSAQTHGPFTGWSYSTAAISPINNDQWVLWKHTTGQVSLWRLNSNSVYQSSTTMGPFTGWSAEELAISPADGKLRLLWKNTDGSVSLWRLSSTGSFEAANNFGPFAGWTAQTLTVGPSDNKIRILWENNSGAIAVWRLTTADGYEASMTYGPFSGWLTLGMVMRPDNKLQLPWDRTADHAFSLWRLNDTEGFEAAPSYGPYAGWQVFGGDVDGANKPHILWHNTDGSISLWRLSPTGALENTANFGPY
jgi:sugar lactone lactonase YvrE